MWPDNRDIISDSADGVVIFFDLTRADTFEAAKDIYAQLHEYLNSGMPIVLVGNKLDLAKNG